MISNPRLALSFSFYSFFLFLFVGINEISAQTYDLVLSGGKVMDPASGLSEIRQIGIRDGQIAAISRKSLKGARTIEVDNMVVAPGFIDLHSHGQDDENYRYYVLDGVTTALELELGVPDISEFYAEREGGQLVNYGASIGHPLIRIAVMDDHRRWPPTGPAAMQEASADEISEIKRRIQQGLEHGAVGVGVHLGYTPGTSSWEVLEIFKAAEEFGAPIFIHMRNLLSCQAGLRLLHLSEVLATATITKTPLHVVHINSSAVDDIRRMLSVIESARDAGIDVTTEAYPYRAGQSRIESSLYQEGWQERLGISFKDLEWVNTGERLTAESFEKYRKEGGYVVTYTNTRENVRAAIKHPLVMVAGDGRIRGGKGHPRTTGTHTRILGRHVREWGDLTLMQALKKMTIMPARRLEKRIPAMRVKGRLQVGADADITIFDPETVIDRSTYREPTLSPEGIKYVIVAGVLVVNDSRIVKDVLPGRAVRAPN